MKWGYTAGYLAVPTALALLWGPPGSPADFLDVWLQSAIVTACTGGTIHGLAAVARPRLGDRVWVYAPLVVIGTVSGGEVAAQVLAAGWGHEPAAVRWGLIRIGLVVSTVTTSVFVGYGRLRAQVVAAELREERARRAALLAELRAIQARTEPHFLFNSLNVVASLIEEDPTRAEQVLERLSALFRYALTAGRRTTVPLRDELAAIEDHLVVEGARFDDRLSWQIEVGADCGDVPVPPFLLQPLVENAVRHGLGSRPGPGRVRVEVQREGNRLVLAVEDDGVGPGCSSRRGTGTAVADLTERLRLLYDDRAELRIRHAPGGGTLAVVELPLEDG